MILFNTTAPAIIMTFYDKFLKSPSFVDCVTHSNLVLYIVLKEYICSIKLDESMFADTDEDEDRVNLYMSLYNILKEMPLNSFECLSTSAHKLPRRLQALTRGRIERLRNTFEAVQYTHPKSLKESVFSSGLSLENEEKFIVTKDSVFGLFLRKFALGFHHQSFEEMTKFLDSFFEAYDAELVGSFDLGKSDDSFTNRSDLYPVSTRNRAQDISSQIASCMGRIGGRPTVGPRKIDEMLELSKKLFPELPTPHYTSHLLATKKRNFTEAEKELHAYFETRMSSDESSKNLSNTCAYMAIAAATMHLSFGHWSKGNQLEKEALKKALESESKTPLKHVQIAHTLLNPSTEPFRYDGQISVKNHYRSMSVAFAELRTKFWDMVDKGSPPDQLLAFYFNSPVATSPTYFAPCLFDLASLWSLYGYPILSTALLQCVINADCLQPCPTSDAVLSAAFACMIREISSEGAEVTALKLAKACEAVLCRFSEKSAIRQASLLVELEAGLRSKVDLPKCDRLVNAIRLCCPWEAALCQADVERCRGNMLTCHDLLQHVVNAVSSHLGETANLLDNSLGVIPGLSAASGSCSILPPEPFSHIEMPSFEDHIPVGGLAILAQIGLRALLSLAELFLTIDLYQQVRRALNLAKSLAKQYRFGLGENTVDLLQHAADLHWGHTQPSEIIPKLDYLLSDTLHRASRHTQVRCTVFCSRIRAKTLEGDPKQSSFLQMHRQELLNALEFYRQGDDRRRVLDILVLLAAALNATGDLKDRNEVAHAFNQLRNEYGYGRTHNEPQFALSLI